MQENISSDERIFQINISKMNQVLKQLRTRYTFEELWEAYLNFQPKFKPLTINNCTLNQMIIFSKIFKFQGSTLEKVKRELNQWLKNYQIFYNDNAEIIYNNMFDCLNSYNSQNSIQYPYIRKFRKHL